MAENKEKKETVQNNGLPPHTCEGPVFYSPSGDKVREFFQWNEDETELVKVGEEDIQKAMDERAKGMTINEQIERLSRGDNSVLREGEGLYADVYEYPEMRGEALKQGEKNLEALQALKEKEKAQKEEDAKKKNELDEKVKALESELAQLKGKQESEGEAK